MNRTRFVRAFASRARAASFGLRAASLRAFRARRDVPVWLFVLAAFVAGFMIGEAHVTSLVQAMRTGTYGD